MTQKEALEILKQGHSVFITGAAGSGKTYLLNQFIQFLSKRGIGVGITASTGIAATHLGGFTIHSWAGIGIGREASDAEIRMMASHRRVAKRFATSDVLIIDEISMLDADRLNLVERVARAAKGSFKPFGGMQVVLCGDFFQLPPVAKEGEPPPRFAYHSAAWRELNPKICYLTEQFRQGDNKLLKILNAIRQRKVDDEVKFYLSERHNAVLTNGRITKLYAHNSDVDAENMREMRRLPGEEVNYQMEASGVPAILNSLKSGCLAPEVLTLKKDAKVIFVKNNFERGYVNGTLGTVSDFDKYGYPVVTAFDGHKIIAAPESWSIEENGRILAKITQIPIRLAWAITIHKSQGMTLDAAEINLIDAFERGMGYVALSRVRSLAGLRLLGFNDIALEVHSEISVFDQELRSRSEEDLRELCSPVQSDPRNRKPLKTYSVFEIRKSHPAAYQKWIAEDEERLIAEFRKGKTVSMLAGILGRKKGGISARLKKLGLVD
jgi:ATP-dependent exoDNAse (exonuclease V) alpha subunit